ncbi:hypothetical protein A2U01_0001839 [Trifolium medium]|uniref:Uncharacterized protein n=1 Tax=Trifolium medium TaxID=97028 RepID=A0A392M182_9FABA|nr:hypothetical protein [Trifolium medium]
MNWDRTEYFLLSPLTTETHNCLCFLNGTSGVTSSSSGQDRSKNDGPKKDSDQAAPECNPRFQKWWSKRHFVPSS